MLRALEQKQHLADVQHTLEECVFVELKIEDIGVTVQNVLNFAHLRLLARLLEIDLDISRH